MNKIFLLNLVYKQQHMIFKSKITDIRLMKGAGFVAVSQGLVIIYD